SRPFPPDMPTPKSLHSYILFGSYSYHYPPCFPGYCLEIAKPIASFWLISFCRAPNVRQTPALVSIRSPYNCIYDASLSHTKPTMAWRGKVINKNVLESKLFRRLRLTGG